VDEIGGNEDKSLEILSEKNLRNEEASSVGLECGGKIEGVHREMTELRAAQSFLG